MVMKIGAEGSSWDEILSSLHKVARGDEDISMDVNVVAERTDEVQMYVRNYQNLQVIHKLQDNGSISLDISQPRKLVFNSEILRSIIQQAKDRYVDLSFSEHEFEVRVGEGAFMSPTTLDLRLVQESQFQSAISVDDLKMVGKVERDELLDTLRMFETVSKVVSLDLSNGLLNISVSDKVQGSGDVTIDVRDECEIHSASGEYKIRPIRDFLAKVSSDFITVQMASLGTLELVSSSTGMESRMALAPRKDTL